MRMYLIIDEGHWVYLDMYQKHPKYRILCRILEYYISYLKECVGGLTLSLFYCESLSRAAAVVLQVYTRYT